MDECSRGLAVPPLKLHAALFYSQTGENELDPMSNHGGCPPTKGVKYGANMFMWNVDAQEGTSAMISDEDPPSDGDTSEGAVEDNGEETES
ncbi:hypothetical protein AeNC1_018083 [Aphanomyces euteiches]|nr:hypothetical protein AeNC1_018083 [Aphanomyces euteiches]